MRIATGVATLLLLLTACSNDPDPAAIAEKSPVWTVQTPAELGDIHRTTVSGDTVFVIGSGGLAAFAKADGKQRWFTPKKLTAIDDDRYLVNGDAVIELGKTYNGKPAVYDLATGTKRFELPESRATFATSDSLLATTCTTFSVPCTLTAHDLRTGKAVWKADVPQPMTLSMPNRTHCTGVGSTSVADYVEPMLAQPRDVVIAVHKPFKKPITVRSIDVRTGKVTRTWQMTGTTDPSVVHIDGGHVGGRMPEVTGADSPVKSWVYDLNSGTFFDGKQQPAEKDIAGCPGVGEMTMVADSAQTGTRIFELFTGAPLWTSHKDHRLVGAIGDAAVVWSGTQGNKVTIASFDIRKNTQNWSVQPGFQGSMRAAFTTKHVVCSPTFANKTHKLKVYDAKTGAEIWGVPNAVLFGVGSDWLAAGPKGSLSFYLI